MKPKFANLQYMRGYAAGKLAQWRRKLSVQYWRGYAAGLIQRWFK